MPHLKVLCLHGYRQNSDVFREKTGGLRKSLKKFCEFKFISAPNVIECSSNAQESSTYDAGFRESILAVKKYIKEEGPFDGMLGFSQGAAFLLLLQIMMEHKLSGTVKWIMLIVSQNVFCLLLPKISQIYDVGPIKFTILVAPFISRCLLHQAIIYVHKTSIPSLVVYGETDSVIPRGQYTILYCENLFLLQTTHRTFYFLPSLIDNQSIHESN
ncbi:uncharacterized protein DC041_0005487 [Schistosoma bovis]|uniref:Serine hydrolase domain-containing protein n=1 Tax=Schistosoma bovis TaxID=6184 RepID=A0A430QF80_SCHBO|nr:uncharacterized protein DC041_0005487 [Schistosoma bovis]